MVSWTLDEVPIPTALAGYEIEAVSLDDFDHLLVEVTP